MTTLSLQNVCNWIGGVCVPPISGNWLQKFNPHTGNILCNYSDSSVEDMRLAILEAKSNFFNWSEHTPIKRGQILTDISLEMRASFNELAACIALETGKSLKDAEGEVRASILQAEYFAGEGMRLYGRTITSGIIGKYSHSVRQPRGVAGLIVPANTSLANIAWKVFPALICGNSVVLKSSEDAPLIANLFAQLTQRAGLPNGVFNVVHGKGHIVGAALVEDARVNIISFTGSTAIGMNIAAKAGERLARVSLELGGKNPFVVCDDADIENAVHWAALSAFSNAGQRCAAGSRLIIFESIYKDFRERFRNKAQSLLLGIGERCDLGPVINARQKENILNAINRASTEGANILCGGLPEDLNFRAGYYIAPTVIESLSKNSFLDNLELFGPVATIQSVKNIEEALEVANSTEFGLTSAIHTMNVDRAMWFAQRVKAGVANVNLGTFGSEPHMPFGGFGFSGNGSREPGVEALDVYSEIKNISFLVRTKNL